MNKHDIACGKVITLTKADLVIRKFKEGTNLREMPLYYYTGYWFGTRYGNTEDNALRNCEEWLAAMNKSGSFKHSPYPTTDLATRNGGLEFDIYAVFPACLFEPDFNEWGEVAP